MKFDVFSDSCIIIRMSSNRLKKIEEFKQKLTGKRQREIKVKQIYKKVLTAFIMQVKRRYLMLLKKDVVESGLKRRRGECNGCGACCQSSFPCPFLYEKDGKFLCKIHKTKPDVCKTYPFNEADVFPHTKATCGYYFVDEDEENDTESEKKPT